MKLLAAILAAGVALAWFEQAWIWYAIEAAIFLLAGWRAFHGRLSWPASPWFYPLAAGTLWPWVQVAARTSVYGWETYAARLTWTAWLGVYLIAGSAVRRDRRERSWMLDAMTVLSAMVALAAMWHRSHDSQYVGFVLLTLPMALWHAEKWMFAGPALQAVSVLVTGSVPESILMVVETLSVLSLRAHFRIAAAGLAIAALLIVGSRIELTGPALEMARAHPVFGVGLGTWQTAYPAYAHINDGTLDLHAPNDWVQWVAEGGAPFFLLMLPLVWGAARAGWRTGWAVGLAFALGHSLIAPDFHGHPIFGAVFFMIAALARESENY